MKITSSRRAWIVSLLLVVVGAGLSAKLLFGQSAASPVNDTQPAGQSTEAPKPYTAPNPLIDPEATQKLWNKAMLLRETRRVSEADFIRLASEPNTLVLDARSANRFAEMHIVGAKNLPYTDFTAEALASVIPSKQTRILIYCNNNIAPDSPPARRAFASKIKEVSLNTNTFPALVGYGYENVYELGPVIKTGQSKIKFEGTLAR